MNTIPSFVFLILALALLVIAGGLGIWLLDYVRGGGKGSPKENERAVTAVTATDPAGPAPSGEQDLLRVSRTENEKLAIYVQGQHYNHLREIKDPQMGREAIAALKAVLEFAEGWLPALRQETPPPSSAKPTVSIVDEEEFLVQLRQADLFPMEKKPPGLLDGLRRRVSSSAPDQLLTPAEAINNLVQQRLQKYPQLDRHNIHLTTNNDGSLCIHVGTQTFAAVDDIPEPQVQALIRDAIHEWKEG